MLGKDRFVVDVVTIGNTVSNSMPISSADKMYKENLSGNVLMTCGFGVGYFLRVVLWR